MKSQYGSENFFDVGNPPGGGLEDDRIFIDRYPPKGGFGALCSVVSLAGLLHDIGKACEAFQLSMRGGGPQLFRHEAVSVLMLSWLVKEGDSWPDALKKAIHEKRIDGLIRSSLASHEALSDKYGQDGSVPGLGKRSTSASFQALTWLILSHHHLPDGETSWNKDAVCANFRGHLNETGNEKVFSIRHTELPWNNPRWQAAVIAHLDQLKASDIGDDFLDHVRLLGRPALLLADHHFSSYKDDAPAAKDSSVAYANTRCDDSLGQTLTSHSIGVARHVRMAMQFFLTARDAFDGVARGKLQMKASTGDFAWQEEAMNCMSVAAGKPFFGVMIADTGSGKTQASLKVSMAISQGSIRTLYASPMRMLTLQSGKDLRNLTGLGSSDLAVVIGDPLIKALHDKDSGDDMLVDGVPRWSDHRLMRSFHNSTNRMISAPILAATLDTVMRVSDGRRGSYISHLLRIASSDLIIDEADMYAAEDQAAIGRMLESAGFYGCRVILSSATISPVTAKNLYRAWRAGVDRRASFDASKPEVLAGWMSNRVPPALKAVGDADNFLQEHREFIGKVKETYEGIKGAKRAVAGYICKDGEELTDGDLFDAIKSLHCAHHVCTKTGKRLSAGCIQVVNVDDCRDIALKLRAIKGVDVAVIAHYGDIPLATRNVLESAMNVMLTRKNDDLAMLKNDRFRAFVEQSDSDDVCLIVVSTMESTGRDHDFDWAIIESRSYRDIIQLAGRIRRHRPARDDIRNLMIYRRPLRGTYCFIGVNDEVFGSIAGLNDEITYPDMIAKIHGSEHAVIDNRHILDSVDLTPSRRPGGKTVSVTDVRMAEQKRSWIALEKKSSSEVSNLHEWLASPPMNRMLSNIPEMNPFRKSTPECWCWPVNNPQKGMAWASSRELDKLQDKLATGRSLAQASSVIPVSRMSNAIVQHMLYVGFDIQKEIERISRELGIDEDHANVVFHGVARKEKESTPVALEMSAYHPLLGIV